MIKFLVMDVDGTLTDGKIYTGNNGEIMKAFDVKDGYGIKELLPQFDIIPIIITARNSDILEQRCKEIHVSSLFQGIHEKFEKLTEVITEFNETNHTLYTLKDCAYIGDDILDIQCMQPIKEAGGKIGCPADAVPKVRELAEYVSTKNGGSGAVRDFIEWLVEKL